EIPKWSDRLAESSDKNAIATCGTILEALRALSMRPRLPDVRQTFLATSVLPASGLPVNLSLAGLAERDYLGGGLPPTRLLTFIKLRQAVRPLVDRPNPDTSNAARAVVARLHLLLHSIYKPDENAQDKAVRVARSRNPAADHSSHAIIIYDLK
ncbi:MAG: hypothetical protein L0215_15265, partial [Gemmataceae bacterium]|nr:hypothetical protein [Gemmataceae bacterium]